ncbi:MAG: YihY/virulence factor BrkB family protein, partial [Candidatus Sulfotelmatobacter sp.]
PEPSTTRPPLRGSYNSTSTLATVCCWKYFCVDCIFHRLHLRGVTFFSIQRALGNTYRDLLKDEILQAAAALSYYALFGAFPALILLSALLAHFPVPDFFQDALFAIGRVAPPGTLAMLQSALSDIPVRNPGAWLSLGTLGALWVISSTFDELIESLDAAYGVQDSRPFWKTRLLAIGLAALTALFLICGIGTMIIGPRAGGWIAAQFSFSNAFILVWPYLHWGLAALFAMLTVETIYFLAPQVKQRFVSTLPGAVLCVVCWIGLSHLLGIYFRHFANYNRTYGTLGGVMAVMTWLYWGFFILLAGCELNSELEKERNASRLSPGESLPRDRRSGDRAA